MRKNKKIGYISIAISALLVVGCGAPAKEPVEAIPEESPTTASDVIFTEKETPATAEDFSKYVYQIAHSYMKTADRNKTYVFSPYSVCGLIGMVNNGATGETKAEIETALGIQSMDAFNASYRLFQEQDFGEGSTFQTAYSIWKDEKLSGDKAFSKVCKEYYDADVFSVNFSKDCEQIRSDIQSWVAEKTNNFIPDYQSTIDKNQQMTLLNTVYMKGKWRYPFDASSTYEQVFHGLAGEENVPFMHLHDESFLYYKKNGCVAIELPYRDSNLVMRLVMAERGNTIETWNGMSVEEQSAFLNALGNSEPEKIGTLSMPKLDYNDKISNLKEILQKMGICKLFEEDAELEAIGKDILVTDVAQQVRLQVDEAGTEAAAVTEMMCGSEAIMEEETVDFIADKPFLLVLQDKNSGTILFMGNIVSIGK